MIIRKTQWGEIDTVMDILAQGRAAIGALGIDQWQGGYPNREMVESDVSAGKSYVVEEAGAPIATFMFDLDGDASYDSIDGSWMTPGNSAQPDYACVHRVAVAEAGKGKGVAKFILGQACDMARESGASSVRIDTHEGNVPMRSLLERCGFEYRGVISIGFAGEGTPERVAYEKRV